MKKLVITAISLFLIISSCSKGNGSKVNYPPHSNGKNYPESDETNGTYASPTESTYENGTFDVAKDGNSYKQNKNIVNQSIKTDDINPKNVYNTKIIKTADLKIKVKDVKKSSSKITNLVDMNGGYVSSENLQSNKNYYLTIEKTEDYKIEEYEVVTSNIIYIRIPTQNFQKVLKGLKSVAVSEDYVKIDAQDVTEEYYDLETRLKTKKEVEQRYIEILKSKAKTVSEILTAEEKIRALREEIEAVEGRLKYIQNKVSLSSIQIELYQNPIFIQETIKYKQHQKTGWSFLEKAGKALNTGWNVILEVIIGLLYIWPFLIIVGITLWILRKKIKNRKGNI
jgi:hypothetical protein